MPVHIGPGKHAGTLLEVLVSQDPPHDAALLVVMSLSGKVDVELATHDPRIATALPKILRDTARDIEAQMRAAGVPEMDASLTPH